MSRSSGSKASNGANTKRYVQVVSSTPRKLISHINRHLIYCDSAKSQYGVCTALSGSYQVKFRHLPCAGQSYGPAKIPRVDMHFQALEKEKGPVRICQVGNLMEGMDPTRGVSSTGDAPIGGEERASGVTLVGVDGETGDVGEVGEPGALFLNDP